MLYDTNLTLLYPMVFVVIVVMAGLGIWFGAMARRHRTESTEFSTFVGASLGLLALLLGFSFSLALSRFDARRSWVLEEANAISSTANFALMLPAQAQRPILRLLREYTVLRRDLNVPYDPPKMARDITQSAAIQTMLWRLATQMSREIPPLDMVQTMAMHRFIASLNEMINVHERRITALRYRVPGAVTATLVGVALLVIASTGYYAGVTGSRRYGSVLMMSLMVGIVIMLIFDLDRPTRGLIQVPVQALQDTYDGIPISE